MRSKSGLVGEASLDGSLSALADQRDQCASAFGIALNSQGTDQVSKPTFFHCSVAAMLKSPSRSAVCCLGRPFDSAKGIRGTAAIIESLPTTMKKSEWSRASANETEFKPDLWIAKTFLKMCPDSAQSTVALCFEANATTALADSTLAIRPMTRMRFAARKDWTASFIQFSIKSPFCECRDSNWTSDADRRSHWSASRLSASQSNEQKGQIIRPASEARDR